MTANKKMRKFVKTSTSIALVASTLTAALPANNTVEAAGFSDLTPANSHYDNILQLLERKIIQGYPDGSYRPNDSITRGQAAKIISSILNLNNKAIKNIEFTDVPTDHQYYTHIAALVGAGVIQGYDDKTFKPQNKVTRGQMAKMIARAFNLSASSVENPFTDIPKSHEYYSYITALYEAEVTEGKSATSFDMKGHVTRGQLASFVIRAEKVTMQESVVKGAIEQINADSIQVNGTTYSVDESLQLFVHEANKPALQNAAITFTEKNGVIQVVESLALTNGAKTFNGFNSTIEQLAIPKTYTSIESITSDSITFETTAPTIDLNEVSAKEMTIRQLNGTTASLTPTANNSTLKLNIKNSKIEKLIVHAKLLSLTEESSTITSLFAELAHELNLNGHINQLHVSGLAKLLGTAHINTIHWLTDVNNTFVSPTHTIKEAILKGITYSWQDALNKLSITTSETNSQESNNNSSNGGSNTGDNGGSDTGSNTGDNGGSDTGANTGDNGGSDNGSNTGDNGGSDNGANTGDNGGSDNGSNTGDNGGSDNGANTGDNGGSDNGANTGDNNGSNGGTNTEDNDDIVNQQQIEDATVQVENGKLLIATADGEQPQQYTVADAAIEQLLVDNGHIIQSLSFDATNNEITAIRNLTIEANNFDGSTLAALATPLQSLNVIANSDTTLTNIDQVKQLFVKGQGTVSLQNTATEKTVIEGNVHSINGVNSDVLIIQSTAPQLTVENSNAKETIVAEDNKPAIFAAVASLTRNVFAAQNTTTMDITFTGDAGKVLTIERSDVNINLEGEPFSRININNNGVQITAENSKAHLFVSNGVSQLTLDADVKDFTLNLEQPIVISSSQARKIENLTVKTTKSNADVKGWIELINVSAENIIYDPSTLTDEIFKQPDTTTQTFTSTMNYVKFGYYNFNFEKTADATYYYKLVKNNEAIDSFYNYMANQALTEYTDAVATSGIFIPSDVKAIMLYEVNGGAVKVSSPAMDQSKFLFYFNTTGTTLKAITRFGNSTSPTDTLGAVHVFVNGNLANTPSAASNWEKDASLDSNYNIASFNLGFTSKGTREIIVTKAGVSAFGIDFTTNENDFVNALKTLAVQQSDTAYFEQLLKIVAANKGLTYNSFFISKYIEQIKASPAQFTSYNSFQTLFDNVETQNSYDRTATLTTDDLYLNGDISSAFEYSTNGIVKNAISDDGKLTFTGLNQGTTTLRVKDSAGQATLVNVTVALDNSVTAEVLKTEVSADTLIDGQANFRSITDTDGKLYLLPTELEQAAAIIQTNTTATDKIGTLSRVILQLNNTGTKYELSTAKTITPKSLQFSDLGLDTISIIAGTNVNGWVEGNELILFPKYEGKETVLIGNATKSTAVYVDTSDKIELTIAASSKLKILDDLKLGAFVIEKDAISPNVHVYNNGTEVQLFANNAQTGHFIFTDNANDDAKTIVNYEATNTNGKIAVKQFEVLQKNLVGTKDTDATITKVTGNSIRYVDNTILAVRKGVSTVTMSDGTQYEVAVTQLGETYDLNADPVVNHTISAADLHMTDIATIDTTDDTAKTDTINNKQDLLVRLTDAKTSTFTLTSSIGEKAIVHVTKKSDGTYEQHVDRSEISKDDLKLNALTDVTGSTHDVIAARAAIAGDKIYVYNLNKGTRSFTATDGTDSTAFNVSVTKEADGKLKSVLTPVTKQITGHTIDTSKAFTSKIARLVGDTLYAKGEALAGNKETVTVPLTNDALYNIDLSFDPTTGLFAFDETATISYSYEVTNEELGLDTITEAISSDPNVVTTKQGDKVIVTLNGETNSRVQFTGTKGSATASSYVHFVRDDTTSNLEKTVEKLYLLDEKLSDYGLNSNSSATPSRSDIARFSTNNNLDIELFALAAGTTGFEIKDANGKVALFNATVKAGATANDARTVEANVIREQFTTDPNVTATIIEGDAVRTHGNYVYAVKNNASAKVRLSTGEVIQYTVELDSNGQYVFESTPLANAKTIKASDLGLSGNITATGFDTSVISVTAYNDTLTITDATASTDDTEKKTSLVVTDANGKKSIVNVTIAADKTISLSSAVKTTATASKLIHSSDANFVRIDGNDIYAIAEGTATLLVGDKIQQVTVTKTNGHYEISAPKTISSTVLTADKFGFADTANMTIETVSDTSVAYVGIFKETGQADKVIAYSLLNGTTGATDVTIKESDSDLRTVVRLTDNGTEFTHKVAEQLHDTFAADPVIADSSIVRYDKTSKKLYALKEGHTYATVDGRLEAISVSRVNGLLTAAITPLVNTVLNPAASDPKFTALAGNQTDESIIEIDEYTIYAKAVGQTKVQRGDQVYIVNVSNDNGPFEMKLTAISSKTVTKEALGLAELTSAAIVQNTEAITFSRTGDKITIYGKGAATAQTLTVKVTDKNGDHSIINVTVNENGEVTKAETAVSTYTMPTSLTSETSLQTAKARAVWNGNTLTVYALEAGKTKFKFADALVNVNTTTNGNLLGTSTITPLTHNLTVINEITNGAIMNNHYVTGVGTALAHTADKVHSVSVQELVDEYKLTVSAGVPFETLTLADGSTFVTSGLGSIAVKDEDEANKLIVYKDGEGNNDIAITSGSKTVVHQAKSDATGLTVKEAKEDITGKLIEGSTLLDDTTENASLRLEGNILYYLSEGTSTFKLKNDVTPDRLRLANVQVTRDANGFFTSTQTAVSATVKQKLVIPNTSTTYEVANDTTVYALNGPAAKEVFYTDDYRVALETIEEDGQHRIVLDERKMKAYNFSDFGLSGDVKVVDGGNTKPTVASFETREFDGKDQIVFYAGDVAETTNITLTDGTTTVTFIINVDENGNIIVSPQAALNSVLFDEIELKSTDGPITINNLHTDLMSATVTSTGINIVANTTGQGTLEVKQGGSTKAILNVTITELANGQFKVTATPLTFTTTGTSLLSTATVRASGVAAGKYYVTSSGYVLFESAANKAYYANIEQNTSKHYTISESTHNLQKFTAAALGLDTIESASVSGSVGTLNKYVNTNKNELYIIGLNDGQAEVRVKGTKDSRAVSAVIVTENGATLEANIASKDASELTGNWTPATGYNEIANIRNSKIYALATGHSVYKNGDGHLLNITITTNANSQYDISYNIVAKDYSGKTVEVLEGTSVVEKDSKLYAKEEGISTIKVGDDYFTAIVVKTSDGLYKLEVSAEPIVQTTYTAGDLGVDTISSATVSSITGAGVVTTKIQNNELIIYAKNTGQAEIRINDDSSTENTDETETIIHALVTETNGKLVLTPTIAKVSLTGNGTAIVDPTGVFRVKNKVLFATDEGHEVATVNDELYNLIATKVNNALKVEANRIEMKFDAAVETPTDETVIKIDADTKTVIALKPGISDVTVDGQTYRITVSEDGSIKKDLIQSTEVDVSEALSGITEVKSDLTTVTTTLPITSGKFTLTPKANATGSEIVIVKNGTQSIQLLVTVSNENGETKVQSEIVKQTFNTSTFGFSPLDAKLPSGAALNISNGIVKVDNLALTVYPGEPGTSHAVVTGNEQQQAIYTLNVDTNYNATFTPFTFTVSYNDIEFLPNVLSSTGTAKAIGNDAGGFNVQLKDFNESLFVVQGDNTSYKVIKVQAEHDVNEVVTAKTATVQDAHVVAGEVTAASDNLKTVKHNDNSVVYTNTATSDTGYYKVNDMLFNVDIDADYTINASRVEQSADANTAAVHLQGDDVAEIVNEQSTNTWVAKTAGTGIYKVGDVYVTVTVMQDADKTFAINVGETLTKGTLPDTTLTDVTVISPDNSVYVDDHTIYGTATNTVVVKAKKDGKQVLYTGTVTDKTIAFTLQEESLKDLLGWTAYSSHDLNSASSVARIEGDTIYPLAVGTENITFTSPSGLSQMMTVTVANDYTVTITPTNENVITYSTNHNNGLELVTYTFTFDLNVTPGMDIQVGAATVGDIHIDKDSNKISIIQPTGTQKVYGLMITIPELGNTPISFDAVINHTGEFYIQTANDSKLTFKKTN